MSPFSPRLRRFGPTNWEGWFLIAVAGRGQAVRWTKTHLFRSAPPRGFHPLSEFEGLSSPGELVTYIATADSIREQRDEIATDDPGIAGQGFGIDLDDLAWQGEPPRYTFARSMDDGVRVDLQVETRDRVDWVRLPGLINYFGYHSGLAGTVTLGEGRAEEFSGLGVQEHAWGASLPFDPNRFVLGPWHWDVLSFEEVDGEGLPDHAALAALSVPIPGLGSRCLRAMGRLPGEPFGPLSAFRVEHLEFGSIPGPDDRPGLSYPTRWRGSLRNSRGSLSYEAWASTPPVRAVEFGCFLGFDFEAVHEPRSGPSRRLTGSGFCECGSPTWAESAGRPIPTGP